MSHTSRFAPFAAINALALAALCGLLSSCAMFGEDPAPAPVAQAAPKPTPAPTPAPVVYSDGFGYLDGSPAQEVVPPSLLPATDDLRAAAIMQLFKDPSVPRKLKEAGAGAGYVAVGPNKNALKDPSDALFSRVQVPALTLKKFSQCVAGDSGVRDAASGARGAVIRVCRVCWTGPSSAMVEYGYSTGGIKGQTVFAEAQRVGNTWNFTERKITIY